MVKETRDYLGALEYSNGALEAIYHEEGRAIPENGTWKHNYLIRDHLGNTRVVFENDGTGEARLVSKSAFYPFGMEIEELSSSSLSDKYPYLFNGKELETDFGLNLNDFGNRRQDPTTGLFTTIDRFAEKYASFSPYSYAANNPIKFVDVNGDSIIITSALKNNKDGFNAFKQFASTKEGRSFLAQYASKGQTLFGYTFKEAGKYDEQGVDLIYTSEDLGPYEQSSNGTTNLSVSIGKNVALITVTLNSNKDADYAADGYKISGDKVVFDKAVTLFHESFMHVDMFSKDYLDNCTKDYSNITETAKKQAKGDPLQYHHNQVRMNYQKTGDTGELWPATAYRGIISVNNNLKIGYTEKYIKSYMWNYNGGIKF